MVKDIQEQTTLCPYFFVKTRIPAPTKQNPMQQLKKTDWKKLAVKSPNPKATNAAANS
jgi:hypothetical protein